MSGTHSKTFRRNIFWQLVGSGGQMVLGGGILLLMGRALGAHDFGIFAIVMSLVYVATGLLEPRMQDVAAKQFWNIGANDGHDHHVPYFLDLLILEALAKLVPCIVLVALSPILVSLNNLDGEYALLPLAALGFFLSKLGNGLALGTLRVLGRSDLSSACLIGEQALRLSIMLAIMALSQLTALNSILTLCIAGIVSNFTQWLLVRNLFRRVHVDLKGWRLAEALVRLRENRRLLLSNIGLSISDLMNKDLDVSIISTMMSPAAVGIYKMAKNIAILTWKAIDPVYLALMPEVNRLVAQRQFDSLTRLLKQITAGMLALAIILSTGVYVAILLFGTWALGPAFADIGHYIPFMLFAIVIAAPLLWGHPLLVALDSADAAVYGILAAAIIGIICLFLLTPALGLYGAIAGWMVTFSLTFIFLAVAAYFRLKRFRLQPAAG